MRRSNFSQNRNNKTRSEAPQATKSFICSTSARGDLFCHEMTGGPNPSGPFVLVSTTNVGYPQDELPTHVLINGQPNPCYFQVEQYHRTRTIHHGSAVEPTLAVNPKDPKNIVAAWQQDRLSGGGALEAGIAYTFDGGQTWNQTEVPIQLCEGGVMETTSDVWLSFSKTGRLYLCHLSINNTPTTETANQAAIMVTISNDGGQTWGLPQPVAGSNMSGANFGTGPFLDKCAIVADPNKPENVYAIWDSFIPNGNGDYSATFFSRSTDGGETWSSDTVSFAGEIWSNMGIMSYDPFGDLCVQNMSTCDRSFISSESGVPEDSGINTAFNSLVVLPKRHRCDKQTRQDATSNLARRTSGHLLNVTWRLYPSFEISNTPGGDQLFANELFNYFGQITFFYYQTDIAVVRSQDQGANWNVTATIVVPNTDFAGHAGAVTVFPRVFTGGYNYDPVTGNPSSGNGTFMRVPDFGPSSGVNPDNGYLYVVYTTGQFREDFLPQIGISTSRDGGYTWSERVRINQTPQDAPNPQAFTPSVAVTIDGYVGIIYSDFRNDPASLPNTNPETLTDTWLDIYKEVSGPGSTGIGLDFVQEIRLSQNSYIAQNGPTTTQGVMTNGDYSFLVANKHDFYAAFTQSHDGPFSPPTLFYDDPAHGAKLLLDDNYRQSPYVSVIKFQP